MAVSFNQFFYAIAVQESNGRYGAVNGGSGALGKYQIMPFNIGPWSKRYLNQNWTPAQFLADPKKQDALAFAVLSSYYTKYGARGAASAWYSGNPALANNYRPQNGGPSIGSYVDSVLAKATRAPGTAAHSWGVKSAPKDPQPTPTYDVQDKTKTTQGINDNSFLDQMNTRYPGSGAASSPGVQPVTFEGDKAASGGVQDMLNMVGGTGDKGLDALPLPPITPDSKPMADPGLMQPDSATYKNAGGASSGGMGGGKGKGGWQWQMGVLRAQFPGLKMNSGFRPGAITSSGNVSFHSKGLAVDLPASMAVFNWIRATYGASSRELIFTPAGNKQIKNGKSFVYSGKVVPDHVGHIHWVL